MYQRRIQMPKDKALYQKMKGTNTNMFYKSTVTGSIYKQPRHMYERHAKRHLDTAHKQI